MLLMMLKRRRFCSAAAAAAANTTTPTGPYQRIRGTRDIMGEEMAHMRHVQRVCHRVCGAYGGQEIQTPLLESTAVFARSLGQGSDVITKQMFHIHNGDMVLRPEGTAGVVRALVQRGVQPQQQQQRLEKWYYLGPMFRYERPQRGRLRQFTQLGMEFVGGGGGVDDGDNGASVDVECIAAAWTLLMRLQVQSNCKLLVNSLGDQSSRERYAHAIGAYMRQHEHILSADSRERLKRGSALRILDSKHPEDQQVIQRTDFPRISDYRSETCARRWMQVKLGLETLGIVYVEDELLVRGLDYYSHTCFEFIDTTHHSAQSAVLAGGRYDELFTTLGYSRHPQGVPAIGFAAGIERLMLLRETMDVNDHTTAAGTTVVLVVNLAPQNERVCANLDGLVFQLRHHACGGDGGGGGGGGELVIEYERSASAKKALSRGERNGASVCILVGDDELKQGVVQIRDMKTRHQYAIGMNKAIDEVMRMANTTHRTSTK